MLKVVTNITPPEQSIPHTPAENFELAAGESTELTFRGINRGRYGFDRMIAYAQNPEEIHVTARLNREKTLFENVQLAAIQKLFRHRSLLAPYIIRESNALVVTVENKSASTVQGNIMLQGYDEPYLEALESAYEDKGIPMPQPWFLYTTEDVAANSSNKAIHIEQPSVDVVFKSMAMSATVDDAIKASMQIRNDTIKREVFLEQLNTEFESLRSNVNYELARNTPFKLITSNVSGSDAELSFIAESYVKAE